MLDMGTGLRFWGATQPHDGTFRGAALVSHIHWDHVQGLPFFSAVDRPGARFDVYGPRQDDMSLAEAFDRFMRPPYFPVRAADLRGDIVFHDVADTELVVSNAKVTVRPVPHIGPTNGYRVERDGVSIVYVSDHQSPLDGTHHIGDPVLELCDGADLLIHDAQFTREEWQEKAHWGHCTIDYAVDVAREAGVKRLALFHHDPAHHDALLDEVRRTAEHRAGSSAVEEVICAYEGLTVSFDR